MSNQKWVVVKYEHNTDEQWVDILEVNGPYTDIEAKRLVADYLGPFIVEAKLLLGGKADE